MGNYSIAGHFDQHFKIKLANNNELKRAAYNIRHAVYSKELGWEPENQKQIESDEYDNYAYHCLLEHRRTKIYAGCVRLIVPPVKQPQILLPFEKNCLDSARAEVKDSTKMARGSFGEISRLAVLSDFRRRDKEMTPPYTLNSLNKKTIFSLEEQRNFPYIAIGLYLASLALANIVNLSGVFVMMEPRLNRRLTRLGLPFVQAGDEIDYHGNRAMFYLDHLGFTAKLSKEMQALYNIIEQDLSKQINLPTITPYYTKHHGLEKMKA